MSSQQPFSTPANVGEVLHIQQLSDQLNKLYMDDEYSDIKLIVDGTSFPAHKVILAARSEYFRALLYGGMRETKQTEVELKDTPITAFRHLLKYIYTGHINLSSFKEDLILEILSLSHQYGFLQLEAAISDYLKAILNLKTVCLIYDTSALFHLDSLAEAALVYMDRHAVEVLNHESFLSLSESSVRDLISRDSFCAEEIEVFRAVATWSKANPEVDVTSVLKEIRLSLVNIQDLLKVVRPTDLMPADILLDAIQSRTESKDTDLRYRGYKMPEENVALPRHGATVLVGEVKTALLDGDSKNYDMERGFSRHPIDDSGDKGIVVKLGMPCIINRINLLLWDRDQRAYSYFVEVSMDQKDWVKIVDHSKYHCRSWQFLYFPSRVVRYLRIVGTNNTVNKVFHVVTLEALYSESSQMLDMGLIVPQSNVATLDASALVTEGVCRSRNALLNGDTSNYDWDSGYTCHQLGSGAIVVQLGQPYALESLRMLLWDCDDRSYSYYIEVSTNQRDWEVVCDRTREACRSWQLITFKRRPVVFIRIVGTHNTANEVFHCVHFEAPAMADIQGVRVSPGPRCGRSEDSRSGESNQEEEDADLREESQPSVDSDEDSHHFNQQQMIPPTANLQGINPMLNLQQQQPRGVQDPFQLPLGGAAAALGPPAMMPLQGLLAPGQVLGRARPLVAGAAAGGALGIHPAGGHSAANNGPTAVGGSNNSSSSNGGGGSGQLSGSQGLASVGGSSQGQCGAIPRSGRSRRNNTSSSSSDV